MGDALRGGGGDATPPKVDAPKAGKPLDDGPKGEGDPAAPAHPDDPPAPAPKAATEPPGPAPEAGDAGTAARGANDGDGASAGSTPSAPKAACNSFPGTTGVLLANGATSPIDKVQVGDQVTATDPTTGTTETQTVTNVIVTTTDTDFTDVTVHTPGGDATITSTQRHTYWDASNKQWTDAGNLKPGDQLRSPNGAVVVVTETHSYSRATVTYNLTVNGEHTYYIVAGSSPVLVHNCGSDEPVRPVSIYRTPKRVHASLEKESGPVREAHLDGDKSIYFGELSVAQEYRGSRDFADATLRYDMHPDFVSEFEPHAYRYDWQGPGGTARIEWQIPVDKLDRFNELTLGRDWVQ